jgi:Domain of unknown function DUF29
MPAETYEHDFLAWTQEQAALLRSGDWARADVEHIAQEIESMGKAEKRELISRLAVLLLHLLKWRYQPALRGNSWRLSVKEQRLKIADHIDDNPSLNAMRDEAIAAAYRYACVDAERETGLADETFPAQCPWTYDEMMDENFWPQA